MGGYVVTKPDSTATAIPGVFAAGTLSGTALRQNGTSVAAPLVARERADQLSGKTTMIRKPVVPPPAINRLGNYLLVPPGRPSRNRLEKS